DGGAVSEGGCRAGAEKAASTRTPGSLRCRFYGGACRTARKPRAGRARRAAVELRPEDAPHPDTTAEAAWRELRPVLDEELNRLPQRHRLPRLLCYLEGRTRDDAAEHLGGGLRLLRRRPPQRPPPPSTPPPHPPT